jgi:hypothetical protein
VKRKPKLKPLRVYLDREYEGFALHFSKPKAECPANLEEVEEDDLDWWEEIDGEVEVDASYFLNVVGHPAVENMVWLVYVPYDAELDGSLSNLLHLFSSSPRFFNYTPAACALSATIYDRALGLIPPKGVSWDDDEDE